MDPRYVTNWSAIIEGLRRQGLTFPQIAKCTGIPRTTLQRFGEGATPKHSDGEALLTFWCTFTLCAREQAPLSPRFQNGNARK